MVSFHTQSTKQKRTLWGDFFLLVNKRITMNYRKLGCRCPCIRLRCLPMLLTKMETVNWTIGRLTFWGGHVQYISNFHVNNTLWTLRNVLSNEVLCWSLFLFKNKPTHKYLKYDLLNEVLLSHVYNFISKCHF